MEDPLPNALKRETKERFQVLTTTVKKLDERAQRAESDLNTMYSAVERTGATPTQYRQALDYLGLVNSPDIASQEKALEFMQREVRALATRLGRPVPGVNFLEGHDDLIKEVGEGRLSHQRAMEVAAGRERDKTVRQASEQRTQQMNQQNDVQQAQAHGRAQLDALGAQLQADPLYKVKVKTLAPTLRGIMSQIHPSQWASTFKQAYDNLQVAAPAPTPPPTPRVPGKSSPGWSPTSSA